MRIKAAILTALALAGPAQAGPADDVQALSWLAGSWRSEKDGVTVRETWMAPLGGAMAGVSQTNRPGRPPNLEFMSIAAELAGATFTARLDGQPPTAFALKPGSDGEAVFENLAHDFPQRVIYRRCGEDLCARIEGIVKGEPRSQDWRYTRVR